MTSLQAALHSGTASPSSSGSSSDWYLDSGAASHMSNNTGTLHSVHPSSPSHIIVGSGEHLPITHVGIGSLISGTSPIQLRNVLVSPSLIKNLLSVCQLCRDNPVSVEFNLFGFSVKGIRTRTVILRCDSAGDLYQVGPAPSLLSRPFAGVATVELLHQRLGHPGAAAVQQIASHLCFSFSKSSPHHCRACRLGKHARLPFQSSDSRTHFPFQLLHLDVWTSPFTSISGYRFYLVILDDYTHYVWTFPLKNKSDVLPI